MFLGPVLLGDSDKVFDFEAAVLVFCRHSIVHRRHRPRAQQVGHNEQMLGVG
jgi:hypothetical protein